jgi:hypothetical protein
MTKSSRFAKGASLTWKLGAAAAGLVALGCAAAAQAQPYGGPGYSNYDPCRRDAGQRGVVGALIGGGIGATIGSQAAANHHRTDGSLLGGALGAIAGAAIGNNTAACRDAPQPLPPPVAEAPPPPTADYRDDRDYGDDRDYQGDRDYRYDQDYRDAPPPAPPAYVQREVWVYGRHGVRYRVIGDRYDRYGCTLAESPVYMPDGRLAYRQVRVCPDRNGRFYAVDCDLSSVAS